MAVTVARGTLTTTALLLAMGLVAGCSGAAPSDPTTSEPSTEVESSAPESSSEPSEPSTENESTATDPTSAPAEPANPTESSAPPAQTTPPTSEPPASTPPSAPPASTPPPAAEGPAMAVTSMSCNGSGPHQKLRVQLTANYNNKYRKGITSVNLTRHDERGTAWIRQSPATWAGQYAGQGNRWSGELPSRNPSQEDYGTGNDYGKVLKLRVRTDDGKNWEFEYVIDRPC